jgi:hypothetical protein
MMLGGRLLRLNHVKTKAVLYGPEGVEVVLDRSKVIPDDPGADTPAMVHLGSLSGTFWCCLDTGEIDCGERQLSGRVMEWLDDVSGKVNDFLYRGKDI